MICLVKLSVPNYLCDTAMRNRQRRGTTWHSYTWVPAARKDSAPTKTWSERLGFSRLQPNLALRLHRLPTHTSTCGKRVSSCQLSFTLLLLCLSRPSNVFLFVCDFIREYLSQMRLGFCYDSGQGVNKDAAKAADWYARAVEQGPHCSRPVRRMCGGHFRWPPPLATRPCDELLGPLLNSSCVNWL